MVVRIYQPGHYQAATSVNDTVHFVFVGGELPDIDDVIALDEDAAVFDEAVVLVQADEMPVGN
jgi:hypothetical protein